MTLKGVQPPKVIGPSLRSMFAIQQVRFLFTVNVSGLQQQQQQYLFVPRNYIVKTSIQERKKNTKEKSTAT